MSTITTINASDNITDSRAVINTNFSNLNTDKMETSVLDTDGALTANSDAKVATQKATKTYADTKITNPMTTVGDIIYGGASGAPTRLAKGTSGQYLKMNSGETAPEWGAISGGGDVLGPATNTANYIPQWNGADSKTLANGIEKSIDGTLGDNSDSAVPTEKAVKTYADTKYGSGASPSFGTVTTTGDIELGHASDTTIHRVSAGLVSIEGSNILTASTGLALAGGTMTGDIQLGETDIKLDAVLSGDEKWSGIVIAGTAGATLAVGDVCYLKTADSQWYLVDGILDGTDTGCFLQLGICVLAANDNDATEMLVYGKIRSAAFPAFTVGAAVYLSDDAGDLVVTRPSTNNFVIRKVGYAITAEDLLFNPSNDYIVYKT